MSSDGIPNLVVDLGTSSTKVGWSIESEPSFVFPSVVGRGRHRGAMLNLGLKDTYVGRQAQNLRGILSLHSPLSSGLVQDWDDLSVLWDFILERFPPPKRVLLSVPPLTPKEDLQRLSEILLESESIDGIYLASKCALAMYGGGRTTGICVDSGEDSTYVVPCLEGVPIPGASLVQRLGGKHITDNLLKLLSNGKYSFIDDTFLLWKRSSSSRKARLSVASRFEVVKEAKEQYCRLAPYSLASGKNKLPEEKVLRLPDGNIVVVGEEAYASSEILFAPNEGTEGLHQLVYQSINLVDESLRSRLTSNIALVGGNSLLPGMDLRLSKELSSLLPPNYTVRVQAQKGREFFSWAGGAHLSSLDSFQRLWMSRSDFRENESIDNLMQNIHSNGVHSESDCNGAHESSPASPVP